MLRPEAASSVIEGVFREWEPQHVEHDVKRLRCELETFEREVMNLTRAIAVGSQLEPLRSELGARQDRCHELRTLIAAWITVLPGRFDRKTIEQKVQSHLAHWRGLLTKHVEDGRQFLREALTASLRFTPEGQSCRFEGELALGRLLGAAGAFAPLIRPQPGGLTRADAGNSWKCLPRAMSRRMAPGDTTMVLRLATMALLASVAAVPAGRAQQGQDYMAPRTEHGHPDFQGTWATEFITMLERPPGVENLVATEEQVRNLGTMMFSKLPALADPDVQFASKQLAKVKGEYRTSVIVEPKDGRMPFTKAGADLAARVGVRSSQGFDDPEQRPLAERCLESSGYAPIRTVPVLSPFQIVQTRDYVVVYNEGPSGARLIHLGGQPPADSLRTAEGYASGQWEGDTLVVQTTHLLAEDPARAVVGPVRPLVLSRHTKITERFTRVSETELFYRYVVEDGELYTQPWAGEFSLTRHDGPIYEYACHEGNYSLTNALLGGRAADARAAERDK